MDARQVKNNRDRVYKSSEIIVSSQDSVPKDGNNDSLIIVDINIYF